MFINQNPEINVGDSENLGQFCSALALKHNCVIRTSAKNAAF